MSASWGKGKQKTTTRKKGKVQHASLGLGGLALLSASWGKGQQNTITHKKGESPKRGKSAFACAVGRPAPYPCFAAARSTFAYAHAVGRPAPYPCCLTAVLPAYAHARQDLLQRPCCVSAGCRSSCCLTAVSPAYAQARQDLLQCNAHAFSQALPTPSAATAHAPPMPMQV